MAGIGQELLLLLPRTGHRPRHRTAEHIAAGEQHRQRHKSDEQAAGQQAAEGGLLQRAVGKGDAGGQEPHAPQIAQVVVRQHALVLLGRQGGCDDGRQRRLVRQVIVAVAGDADGAAGVDLCHEAGQGGPVRLGQVVNAGPDGLLHLLADAAGQGGAGKEEHGGEHGQQYAEHHTHVQAHHLPTETTDHDTASSRQ